MDAPMLTLKHKICKLDSIISSDIDEVTLMMDIEKGQYYSLNPVGSKIWKMIDESIVVEVICERLTAAFDVSTEQCQREVLNYLTRLQELDIITVFTLAD